eukprot:11618173-Alexandrium_andersonii.AAC.1
MSGAVQGCERSSAATRLSPRPGRRARPARGVSWPLWAPCAPRHVHMEGHLHSLLRLRESAE